MRREGTNIFNLLSLGLLGLTALTVVAYLIILIYPAIFYNPFPPQRAAMVSPTPMNSPTPSLQPTWTPTNTSTPRASPTPRPTRTPTGTPTITPTWPPTVTPTPRATRSPYPFTCEISNRRPEYDRWTGVAGHIEDLEGEPLPGYHARIECPGAGTFTKRAGGNNRHNLIYGNEAAWEQACNPTTYQAMQVRVQIFNDQPDADGSYRAVSEQLIVDLPGYASGSLGYVVCTLNWEEWQETSD